MSSVRKKIPGMEAEILFQVRHPLCVEYKLKYNIYIILSIISLQYRLYYVYFKFYIMF